MQTSKNDAKIDKKMQKAEEDAKLSNKMQNSYLEMQKQSKS